MSSSRYPANLPSVGLSTFFKAPACEDLDRVEADIAFLGVPYDSGVAYRPGTRFGPKEIRSHSLRYSAWGGKRPSGYWDINQRRYLLQDVSMVDCGDVDIVYYDADAMRQNLTQSVETLLDRGAFPVVIGGDHSISYPSICAFSRHERIDVVQIDAHMDWRDEVAGVRHANPNPMRRAMELPFVRNMAQLGIRDIRSSEDQVLDAEAAGSVVLTRQSIRDAGIKGTADSLPSLGDTYVTIDIDGLDPSIAPGTGSPTVDGLLYHEVMGLLREVAARGNIVGFDIVEVNPMVDDSGRTSLLAANLALEFLGTIFDNKNKA